MSEGALGLLLTLFPVLVALVLPMLRFAHNNGRRPSVAKSVVEKKGRTRRRRLRMREAKVKKEK